MGSMAMAATSDDVTAGLAAGSLAGVPAAGGVPAIAQGAGQTLARKLVGDASRYPHLTRGRSRGATQVLDLDPLRQALGASWAAYGELIHSIAVRILLRHLGGAYEHERYAERYVVVFQDLSEREARERMTRIASALAEFLFGSGTGLAEPVRRRFGRGKRMGRGALAGIGTGIGNAFGRLLQTVGTLMAVKERAGIADKPRDLTLRGGAMDLSSPREARAPAGAAPPAGKNATLRGAAPMASAAEGAGKTKTPVQDAAKDIAPIDPGWSSSRAAAAKPAPRRGVFNAAAPRSAAPQSTPKTEQSDGAPPSAAGTAEDAALKELARRTAAPKAVRGADAPAKPESAAAAPAAAQAAASPAVAKPAKPTEITVDKLSFVYRPMWSVRTNMLAISGCYAAGKLPNGELAIGESVLPPAATLEVIEKVDRAALDHVIAHCLPTMETGRGAIIALPVHYETLYDRERRNNYLNVCRGLSMAARKRLVFECRNIDDTADQAALISTLTQLKPFATMLIGMLPLRTSNFALWKRAGLGSVGVDVAAERGNESAVIDGMHQFALQAGQHGLRATACNLGTLSLAAAALQAGFDFIEGGIIQNQLRPTDVRPFTLEDLYLQYAVARRAKVGPARLLDAADGTPTA